VRRIQTLKLFLPKLDFRCRMLAKSERPGDEWGVMQTKEMKQAFFCRKKVIFVRLGTNSHNRCDENLTMLGGHVQHGAWKTSVVLHAVAASIRGNR
jgi:hypothetical protein